MRLRPDESRLDGGSNVSAGRVYADPVAERIELLITKYLTRVATDASGWEILYRDPQDGRYWMLTYPNGQMHGGGPPSLVLVDKSEIRQKFGLDGAK
jgi:hypothetical protein